MTNFEKIQNMSIEEMADFIDVITNCHNDGIDNCSYCPIYRGKETSCLSPQKFKQWLESEVNQ